SAGSPPEAIEGRRSLDAELIASPPMSAAPPALRRRAWHVLLWALAAAVVFLGPVALLGYFGGARLLTNTPAAGFDFDTHISQVWRVLEGLQGHGRTWVYDVQHLAGHPNGTIFDADN